jgi:hypothetical protein
VRDAPSRIESQKMARSLVLSTLVALAWCFGCSTQAPNPAGTGQATADPAGQPLAGLWEGKPTGQTEGLAASLGGYRLRLQADGLFLSEMRGLVREGEWRVAGDEVRLTTKRIFGKTKEQAAAENKEDGREVNDLKLYDQQVSLQKNGDDTLTLKAASREDETVVFSRAQVEGGAK